MEELTPQEVALNKSIELLEGMVEQAQVFDPDGEAQFDESVVAMMALAWSNIGIGIIQANRFAAARNLSQIASEWLANPTPEGHKLFVAAVQQYRDFG